MDDFNNNLLNSDNYKSVSNLLDMLLFILELLGKLSDLADHQYQNWIVLVSLIQHSFVVEDIAIYKHLIEQVFYIILVCKVNLIFLLLQVTFRTVSLLYILTFLVFLINFLVQSSPGVNCRGFL